jgi:hypothetical protein
MIDVNSGYSYLSSLKLQWWRATFNATFVKSKSTSMLAGLLTVLVQCKHIQIPILSCPCPKEGNSAGLRFSFQDSYCSPATITRYLLGLFVLTVFFGVAFLPFFTFCASSSPTPCWCHL